MKKSWIFSTIAGIALLTAACGNNAATNDDRATTRSAPGTNPRTLTNTHDRAAGVRDTYYRTSPNGVGAYSTTGTGTGTNRSDGFYGTTGRDGAGRTGTAGYRPTDGIFGAGHGRTDAARGADDGYTSTYGTRGSAGYGAGLGSIYHDRHMSTAGVNHQISQIGFVRMDSSRLRTTSNTVNRVYVDRNALAHAVGAVTASVQGVKGSTVLVTDEEVFVGVVTGGQNAKTVKSQARMSAMSVSPRYYKVYVTDDQRLMDEMARIASKTSHVRGASPLDDRAYDPLIRSMGGQPDGEEMRSRGTGMNTNLRGGRTSGTATNTGNTTGSTSR